MSPPPQLSGIMAKLLFAYTEWSNTTRHIKKMRRYSIGIKIDVLFSDIIELVSLTQFSPKESKDTLLQRAITKNDCLKFMLYVLVELNGIDDVYFFSLAPKIEEIGKMLYGWKQNTSKNSSFV